MKTRFYYDPRLQKCGNDYVIDIYRYNSLSGCTKISSIIGSTYKDVLTEVLNLIEFHKTLVNEFKK